MVHHYFIMSPFLSLNYKIMRVHQIFFEKDLYFYLFFFYYYEIIIHIWKYFVDFFLYRQKNCFYFLKKIIIFEILNFLIKNLNFCVLRY
jgi:hypothetical protein